MTRPPCECPNLIRVVESIEWAPGVEGRQREASASDDRTQRGVTIEFDVVDPAVEVQRLQKLLEDEGLPVEAVPSVQGFQVKAEGYRITVSVLSDRLQVHVRLLNGVSDEQAEEVLQPVVEAIGRRS